MDNSLPFDLDTQIREAIKTEGFAIVSSFGEIDFSYTVGLTTTYRHAEIIIFGMPPAHANSIIRKAIHETLDNGEAIKSERYDNIAEGYDIIFMPIDANRAFKYALATQKHCAASQVRFLQMVWPDRNNRFPWEELADKKSLRSQLILYRQRGADEKNCR